MATRSEKNPRATRRTAPATALVRPAAAPASRPAPTAAGKKPKGAKTGKAADPASGKAKKADKADKPRKPKLKRDSFTIPKDEYAVLEQLKERAARAGRPAKKSELLRAGIQALACMADTAFLAAVTAVPSIKTGRPAKA